MYTLEQKIDICLRYIATDSAVSKRSLRAMAAEALQSGKTAVHNTPDTDTVLLDLLKEIGISPHLTGHRMLVHSISMVIAEPDRLKNMGKLSTDVGDKFEVSGNHVEGAIRKAIKSAFDKNDIGHLRTIFGGTINVRKGVPLPREFIVICANEVLRRTGKPIII